MSNPNQPLLATRSAVATAHPIDATLQDQINAQLGVPTTPAAAPALSRTDIAFSVGTALTAVGLWAFFIYELGAALQPPTLF